MTGTSTPNTTTPNPGSFTLVRVRTQKATRYLICEDCETVLWTACDSYFTAGNVEWMHRRGCPDHKVTRYGFGR